MSSLAFLSRSFQHRMPLIEASALISCVGVSLPTYCIQAVLVRSFFPRRFLVGLGGRSEGLDCRGGRGTVNGTVGSILGRKGREIWCVAPDATVYDAIWLMAAKNVGALLVISDGSLLGIVSEVDYARRVILQGRSSKKTPVKDIMTSNPVTVAPEDTVDDCLRIMTHHHIRHLPVF